MITTVVPKVDRSSVRQVRDAIQSSWSRPERDRRREIAQAKQQFLFKRFHDFVEVSHGREIPA